MNYHIFDADPDKANWEKTCPKCGAKPTYESVRFEGLCKKCGLEKQYADFEKTLEWATKNGYIL